MKRKICLLFLCISLLSFCFSNENTEFDLYTFLENPFLETNMYPRIFDSYLDFEKHFKNDTFEISSEILQNKYGEQHNNVRYRLEKNNILLVYLYSGYNGKCFLDLLSIVPNEKNALKYGFYKGMSESSVIDICGKIFHKQNFKTNYELCYDDNGIWQINFSFDNTTNELIGVNIWYEVD